MLCESCRCSEAWVLSQMLPGFSLLFTVHRRHAHCEAAAELLSALVNSTWLHYSTRRSLIPTILALSLRTAATDQEGDIPTAGSLLTGRTKLFLDFLAHQPFAWEGKGADLAVLTIER